VVNGGVLEVAAGGSGLSWVWLRVGDQQWAPRGEFLSVAAFLQLCSRDEPLGWTEGVGEVWFCLSPSPAFLASARRVFKWARLASVFSGTARISVASRSAAPPTRLETRTKESNMCASHWVY
jgi:hypothetical protein